MGVGFGAAQMNYIEKRVSGGVNGDAVFWALVRFRGYVAKWMKRRH
jgi:hypothetical protein